jgi:hypothetical protein
MKGYSATSWPVRRRCVRSVNSPVDVQEIRTDVEYRGTPGVLLGRQIEVREETEDLFSYQRTAS